MTVKDHYDKHLANFYSWMIGEFDAKQQEQELFFRRCNILPTFSKIAFDLDAGHGLQSVSLARLGFTVTAVDFNEQLLAELAEHKKQLSINIVKSDLMTFLEHEHSTAELIVCMGDTLTHLHSEQQVDEFISCCAQRLMHQGKFVISFRDLTTELVDEHRFIPVKSNGDKILTCFLEYFEKHVMVHDILHEKVDGAWQQKISAYPKLRIGPARIIEMFSKHQIQLIDTQEINRMIYLIGEKKITP